MPFKKNEVNKGKILNAALSVFCQNGYKGTTIIDIAKKADVNKALIYYYFQDKEFVFQNILQKNIQNILDEFHELSAKTEEHPLSIESLIRIIRKIKTRHYSFFRLLISELLRDDGANIAQLIMEHLAKARVNVQSGLNNILSSSGVSDKVSLYNREVMVLFLGLISSDIIADNLMPPLLNILSSQKILFQENMDKLICGIRFTEK